MEHLKKLIDAARAVAEDSTPAPSCQNNHPTHCLIKDSNYFSLVSALGIYDQYEKSGYKFEQPSNLMEILRESGVGMIAKERDEQINKHGRTPTRDFVENTEYQLSVAAGVLCYPDPLLAKREKPKGWDEAIWAKMCAKSYEERVTIAGALLAAELDRLQQFKKVTVA